MGTRIIYNGIAYNKSPGRLYYSPSGGLIAKGYPALHRQVWIDGNGPIPDGMHVHHIDGDHDNNDPSNLRIISASEHARLHYREREPSIRARLAEWRESAEGKRTLAENGRKMRERTPARELACAH